MVVRESGPRDGGFDGFVRTCRHGVVGVERRTGSIVCGGALRHIRLRGASRLPGVVLWTRCSGAADLGGHGPPEEGISRPCRNGAGVRLGQTHSRHRDGMLDPTRAYVNHAPFPRHLLVVDWQGYSVPLQYCVAVPWTIGGLYPWMSSHLSVLGCCLDRGPVVGERMRLCLCRRLYPALCIHTGRLTSLRHWDVLRYGMFVT